MTDPLIMFSRWERETPDHLLFHQPLPGQNLTFTYKQAGDEIRRIAAALEAMSLPPRSRIAILSKNCAHWIMADLAIWMAGHISVPLYPTLSAHSIKQILDHSGTVVIFVGKLDEYQNQQSGIDPSIKKISFPFYGIRDGLLWEDLIKQHTPMKEYVGLKRDELATIKYTSGTTGEPKGVMISFLAFDFALTNAIKSVLKGEGHRFFSYLPLSHIAERMLVELGAIYKGATIYFSESLEKFPVNLANAQPTIFLAVPRIWAKFREKILEKMPQQKLNTLLSIPILGSVIKSSIRKKLGLSKAVFTLSGASPISVDLLEWFQKLGITIREVYGMTENLAFAYSNMDGVRFGTVGRPWPDIETRISAEGEIQTRHPATMMGYYKNPAMTSETFTDDGFLKSGDVGELDSEGFLTITGRIKDQFKTDKGKYIAPAPIELKFSSNPDVEHACVVGMGVPQPIALIVLSPLGRKKTVEEIEKSLAASLDEINPSLETYERLQTAVIMKADWTIENGLLTPSLKVRRNEVEKIHLPSYPAWYHSGRRVVWEAGK